MSKKDVLPFGIIALVIIGLVCGVIFFVLHFIFTPQNTPVVAPTQKNTSYTFVCPDTTSFTISYSGQGNTDALLTMGEETFNLHIATSGSGSRYTDATGSLTYSEHAGEAMIEKDGQELHAACVLKR